MAIRSLPLVIAFALFAELANAALLQSTQKLRGNGPATESLVSTASAKEDSEDGVESAEATVKEAEMEASQQEAATAATDNSTSEDAGNSTSEEQAAADQPEDQEEDQVSQAKVVTAAIQTSRLKPSKNASRALAKRALCGPRNIRLSIKGATGLMGQDAEARGVTDPYCVCEVQGKPKARTETMALDGFHGVHWDHDGEIADFMAQDVITCSIYDQDALETDPDYFLGRTSLPGTTLLSRGFKGELHLKDAGVQSAMLKLEVVPLPLDSELAAEAIQEMAKAGCEVKSSKSDDKDEDDNADEDDSENDD